MVQLLHRFRLSSWSIKRFAAVLFFSACSYSAAFAETTYSSAENRRDLKYPGVFGSVSIIGVAAGLVMPLSQDWWFEYIHGLQTAFVFQGSYDVLHARYFIGNSFNVFFGAGRLKLYDPEDKTFDVLYGPSGGLGNEWLFDNGFFLGADWIAIEAYWPVFTRLRLGFMF